VRARRFGHSDLLGRENVASILEAEAEAACYKTGVSSNRERCTIALVSALALALMTPARARAQAPMPPPPWESTSPTPAPPPPPPRPYDAPASADAPTTLPDNPAPLPPPAHLEAIPAPAPTTVAPTTVAPTTVEETPPPTPPTRPRLNVALGMGASFESAGLSPARTALVPAFFATGGVGDDWPVGVEASVFSSSSSGRFASPDTAVDRLALGLIGVVRPFLWSLAPGDGRYVARVARALGLELGLGVERDGTTVRAGSRVAFQGGARVELPLSPAPATKELRVRLAARRMQGFYTPRVGTVGVGDGFELYAALVSVF
jgi:hypothetical protein